MDKLKAILTTTELPSDFSALEGSKRIGEFRKKFPHAAENFEQRYSDQELYGIPKDELNKMFEALTPFAESVFPIIADMFNKIKDLEAKMRKDGLFKTETKTTLHHWLTNRILSTAILLDMAEMANDVDNGLYEGLPLLGGGSISEDHKSFLLKLIMAKTAYGSLCASMDYTFGEFLRDINPKGDEKGGEDRID